jgi:peptidoglycan/LPS O-acetylase OafA/YrhL
VTAGTTPASRAGRFAHVDALRAFAVMVVVVFHAGVTILPGDGAVTVFFVISGFVITFLLLRERARTGDFDLRGFYRRRTFKLAPPFVVVILIPTVIYGFTDRLDVRMALSQVFFSYNWALILFPQASGSVLPGSEIVWSLAVEEQFYLVFAAVWLLLVRRRRWQLMLGAGAAAVYLASTVDRIARGATGGNVVYALRATDTRIDAIALGVLAGIAFHAFSTGAGAGRLRALGSDWFLLLAIAMFFGCVAFRNNWTETAFRPIFQALAGALIVLYGLMPGEGALRRLFNGLAAWRPVQLIGLASYSVYLVHYPLDFLLHPLLRGSPALVETIVDVVAGTAIGALVWRFVERPALALRGRLEVPGVQKGAEAR